MQKVKAYYLRNKKKTLLDPIVVMTGSSNGCDQNDLPEDEDQSLAIHFNSDHLTISSVFGRNSSLGMLQQHVFVTRQS